MTTTHRPVPVRPASAAGRSPARLTVRAIDDLLAAVPVLLGFWPEESVVLMTFGTHRPFHARVDLPPLDVQTPPLRRELARVLLEPAQRFGVRQAAVLYYTADPDAARAVQRALRRAFRRAGLALPLAIVADGERYLVLDHPDPEVRGEEEAYDIEDHPFVVAALVDGRLAHRTRADMVASLDQDPEAAAAVSQALVDGRYADAGIPSTGRAFRDAGDWVAATVRELTVDGASADDPPSDADLARLLWVLQAPRVRDAAWSGIDRATAEAHVRLWTAAVCRSPDPLVAAPAALLGWAAWQAGDGALAWAAVDRCRAADPAYPLAGYLAAILEGAVPPEHWPGGFAWDTGLPARADAGPGVG